MTPVATSRRVRVRALDAWRGLIVVVMALDHANSLVAHGRRESEMWTTQYPDYGGDWLDFLTRWVTHLAAPGFFFLLGVGAVLFTASRLDMGWKRVRIVGHLMLRGCLLIVFQFVVENPAWRFGEVIPPETVYIGVLYALGVSLIVASLLTRLPAGVLVALGLILLLLTELILPQPTPGWMPYTTPELLFLWPGVGDNLFSLYPAVPWLGVTLLGLAFGRWYQRSPDRAMAATLPVGMVMIGGFFVLRVVDGFGNIVSRQSGGAIDFLNVTKYPPSITFLLLTLGGGLIATGLFQRFLQDRPEGLKVLVVFGTVPLFFYLAHLWLYAVMGRIVEPEGVGVGLYVAWIVGLVILYPACRWFGTFKATRPATSGWRFL